MVQEALIHQVLVVGRRQGSQIARGLELVLAAVPPGCAQGKWQSPEILDVPILTRVVVAPRVC